MTTWQLVALVGMILEWGEGSRDFSKLQPMKHLAFIFALFLAAPLFAYDGDMDTYHEFKEDLSLTRDGYIACLNMAMESANESTEGSLEGWFNLRDKGGARSWMQLDFEAPTFKFLKMEEVPYGFKLKGSHGAYKIDAEIRVVTRDTDIFYDVKYNKASNAAGKEIFGEVFRNDRVVFYDESTPCKRKAVTCINEYSRGTMGK